MMVDLASKHFGLPNEGTLSCQGGLYQNHYYRDLRGYDASDYDRLKSDEQELLDYDGDLSADEALEHFEDNEVWMLDLDPGVATTVIALCAVGAVPFTSCKGGSGHYEQHPLVGFWADKDHMRKIIPAAKEAGVQVVGLEGGGFLVFTETSVELMLNFADKLVAEVR